MNVDRCVHLQKRLDSLRCTSKTARAPGGVSGCRSIPADKVLGDIVRNYFFQPYLLLSSTQCVQKK